jgi:hypothetical protein
MGPAPTERLGVGLRQNAVLGTCATAEGGNRSGQ